VLILAWYLWNALPIISGYGARYLCSAIYVQHRDPGNIKSEDLGEFPFSLGRYNLNQSDSSVTGTVFGLAAKKAIYRQGLGATLINDFDETAIRSQQMVLAKPPTIDTDTVLWPQGDKLPDTLPRGIDKIALDQALQLVMNETYQGVAARTRAVVVIYKGQLVAEKYATGFDSYSVMLGWSVAKSVTGALIGILVKEGKLATDTPAPVPEWKDNRKQIITVKQLLQQTTGLAFNEDYTGATDVTNMLFKEGDMAAYTAKLDLKYEPGTVFNYSSGNSNVLSRLIRQTVGEKDYLSFPYQALFYKTGMYSMLLEPDASGTYVGSSYIYATARDFARFGLLYCNKGKWNGEQLLPENWVDATVQPAAADQRKHYGYQFWLNGLKNKDSAARWYPDVPADMFFADGYGGQDIYVIPSRELVVVRLGLHVIDENRFLKTVLAAIK
jgi:CubicO group peptidase (beta-lactamase class C family)